MLKKLAQNHLSRNAYLGLGVIALVLLPWLVGAGGGNYWVRVLDFALLYIVLALGLNVVVGFAGLLDLGYIAFYALGAYSYALLASPHLPNHFEVIASAFPQGLHFSPWMVAIFSIILAALFGIVLGLPTLQLRGDYLAIVTLGFGEIVRITAVNTPSIGGPNGIPGVPNPTPVFGIHFGLDNMKSFFWIVLVLILLVIWMVRRFSVRRPGRAWEAIRQDEDVAMLMGVSTLKYKIWSFVIGAAIGGAAGVIFASKSMYVAPDMFTFNISILVLSCVVFGGMGNIWGVIVGGVILAYLPERIRFISDARQLVFGLALVIIMNVRPDGLLPRKKREKIAKPAGEAKK